jgi:hypothetical protein
MSAGLLYRGHLRETLSILAFKGEIEAFHETKGFIESHFLIRGASRAALIVLNRMAERINSLD